MCLSLRVWVWVTVLSVTVLHTTTTDMKNGCEWRIVCVCVHTKCRSEKQWSTQTDKQRLRPWNSYNSYSWLMTHTYNCRKSAAHGFSKMERVARWSWPASLSQCKRTADKLISLFHPPCGLRELQHQECFLHHGHYQHLLWTSHGSWAGHL